MKDREIFNKDRTSPGKLEKLNRYKKSSEISEKRQKGSRDRQEYRETVRKDRKIVGSDRGIARSVGKSSGKIEEQKNHKIFKKNLKI